MAKKPLESKKWIAMLLGTSCVMATYFTSVIAIIWSKGISSGDIVSLANTVIAFLGMIISSLVLGQSAVDWKHQNSNETKNIKNENTESKEISIDSNAPLPTQALVGLYQDRYRNDMSYRPIIYGELEGEEWR